MCVERGCEFGRGKAIEGRSAGAKRQTRMQTYLSPVPDEQEGRGQEFVLEGGERVDEEFDVGCVVLVHDRPRQDRGSLIEDDTADESWDRRSVKPRAEDKRRALKERADGLRRRRDGKNRTVGHLVDSQRVERGTGSLQIKVSAISSCLTRSPPPRRCKHSAQDAAQSFSGADWR